MIVLFAFRILNLSEAVRSDWVGLYEFLRFLDESLGLMLIVEQKGLIFGDCIDREIQDNCIDLVG